MTTSPVAALRVQRRSIELHWLMTVPFTVTDHIVTASRFNPRKGGLRSIFDHCKCFTRFLVMEGRSMVCRNKVRGSMNTYRRKDQVIAYMKDCSFHHFQFWCIKEINDPSKCNFCLDDHCNNIRDV